ncbi:hypothetical protein [Victivallis sp. Marseille-Q1083]|uniref:hypothetical protein n=1 Tax=Victivallis sp. Marseille-Q1083 TaxID=2717288 RepID=UPI0020CA49F8|nr:hypothetical protein [Victivallis sp. Marseille-Q1083]
MLKSATFLLAMACCALIAAEPATTRTFRGIRPDGIAAAPSRNRLTASRAIRISTR